MNNHPPLVSIVIPVYNRVNLITDCINSALSQTYKNFEIIIYDNFSTDGTWEIIENFYLLDSRIRIFRHNKNIGPVKNWHAGLVEASGEFVKILFSDDLMYPNFIEETISKFDDDIGFVITSFEMGADISSTVLCNDWPGLDGPIQSASYLEAALKRFAFLVSPGAAVFRTTDVLAVFEEEIPSPRLSDFKSHGAGPDLLIFLKIALKYSKIYKFEKSLCFFRDHLGSQTVVMNKSKDGLINSSYMQARIHFAIFNYKHLINHMLGKAMFVELFQNKNWKALSIYWVAQSYLGSNSYHTIKVCYGFVSSIFYASFEILRRLSQKRKLM